MTADAKDDRIRSLEDEVRRLSLLLESTPDYVMRATVDRKLLYTNRVGPGYDRNEVLGTSIDAYLPPEFVELTREAIRAACATGTMQEYKTIAQNGPDKTGHYLVRVGPMPENGRVTSVVLVATDITLLEENRTLLQLALHATGLGIWTYEPATGNGTWDETSRGIFGAAEDAPTPHLGHLLAERVHPDDRALVMQKLDEAMQTGQYGPLEHRIVRPGGEVRWSAASGIAIRNPKGELLRIVGTMRDVTERRALEVRLQEAQKLEGIGRLAGGVAHDFNNMLTAILGNVDLAEHSTTFDEARPLLEEIRLTAERSAALTAQLLAFARRQLVEPKVLAPSVLLGRIEALLRRLLGERTILITNLDSVGHVRVDPSQLEQVVLNLVTNARDSLPEGGHVRLTTTDLLLEAADPTRLPDLNPGSYVVITLSDDGGGIPAAALPQIFEPFFTTRRGGTGLGLATCYGIIKQSGGHIAVQSEVGRGATFSVYLPRVPNAASERPSVEAPLPGASGTERVLLVEDEAVVRSVVQRTLERAGYRVVVATSGDEALGLTDAAGRFDLLITDVVMPGINGWELGRRLVQRWPGLPVLYFSGYTEDSVADIDALGRSAAFLQKPFLPVDLLATIRTLLDAQG